MQFLKQPGFISSWVQTLQHSAKTWSQTFKIWTSGEDLCFQHQQRCLFSIFWWILWNVWSRHRAHQDQPLSTEEIYLPRRDKGQETGDKREGRKGTKKMEKGYLPQRYKGLPLNREQTEIAHSQIAIYKGQKKNFLLGWIGLFWLLIRTSNSGFLITGLQYFESLTLMISLRRKMWPNLQRPVNSLMLLQGYVSPSASKWFLCVDPECISRVPDASTYIWWFLVARGLSPSVWGLSG